MRKRRTCCIVGQRPRELPWGYGEEQSDCIRLKARLASEIIAMWERGVTDYISGMAIGVGLCAAEMIRNMKHALPDAGIRLIAAIPFEGQADRWSVDYRQRYFDVLADADDDITLYGTYCKGCVWEASRYMVDCSSYMIAVSGVNAKSAVYRTIEYARSKGLGIVIIRPEDLSVERIPRFRGFQLLKP